MDVATLKRQRGVVKAAITRDLTYANAINKDVETVNILKNRRLLAEQHFKRFEEIQIAIEDQCTTDLELEAQIAEREDIEGKILTILSKIDDTLEEKNGPQHGTATTTASASSNQARLPKLDIPTFNGEYSAWTCFHDLFVAMVHTNAGLTGAQKLQFLKQSLKEEAAGLLRSMPVTDKNYNEAWQMLKNRYDNKRQIINSHLKVLFNVSRIQEETATGLRKILDSATESIRALNAMSRPTQEWDDLIVYFLAEKLDPATREKWESYTIAGDFPNFAEFTSFLEERCRVLEALKATGSIQKKKEQNKIHAHVSVTTALCAFCKKEHFLHQCREFANLQHQEKSAYVKKQNLCYNCLRSGHGVKQCKSGTCRKCQGKHHTLLHIDRDSKQQQETKHPKPEVAPAQPSTSQGAHIQSTTAIAGSTYVLLSTAIINVRDKDGNLQPCRALLDSGSQASFITEHCLQSLRLHKKISRIPINGVAGTGAGSTTGEVNLCISSMKDKYSATVQTYVLPKITCELPSQNFGIAQWTHLQQLKLADPNFNESRPIDILLGADLFPELLLPNQIPSLNGAPAAQDTVFGWILWGKYSQRTSTLSSFQITSHVCSIELDKQLTRFWETEEIPLPVSPLTEEEQMCEESFIQTHRRESVSGRFVVKIPWKSKNVVIGSSRTVAERRLKHMENKFQHQAEKWKEYVKFINEYLQLGHMELVPHEDVRSATANYLPHHMIVKESSTSTKYRIVFDASMKTSNGKSLNDNMLVGAKLQEDLVHILTRFRTHKVAFTADIQKMYRQILVDKSETDYQRILWRESPDDPVSEYRLLTVTYGTASAPFLAVRCLKELAKQNLKSFPTAAKVLDEDFYVDDVISGAPDESTAARLQNELISITDSACLPLRKWSSNSQQFLQYLPEEYRETKVPFHFDEEETIKTLGVVWNPASDDFSFKVNTHTTSQEVTKRTLLSDTARLFDPLGWVAPVIITAKMMFQQLWLLGLDWDTPLPTNLSNNWLTFKSELQHLNALKIPRFVGELNSFTQLHGFCDASERGYSGTVFVRTITDGVINVKLISAKTRVAPVQQVSLPRLELCGATLLTTLTKTVMDSLKLTKSAVHLWTDSTVVLCWLQQHPLRWKNYVANRVSAIQSEFPAHHWRHVSGTDNPADVASRGIYPSQILSHSLWWNGPHWLWGNETEFPQNAVESDPAAMKEYKQAKIKTHTLIIPPDHVIYQYSSFTKLIRVISWIRRFKHNCLTKQGKNQGLLSTLELQQAKHTILKLTQSTSFPHEVENLIQKKPISKKSTLRKLNPILDDNGLLRVGGRLRNWKVSFSRKFPIILPRRHHITNLIIDQAHKSTLHGGGQIVQATIQQQYWIPGARQRIRQHIHNCVKCFKQKPQIAQQFMGDLPASRVESIRPFLKLAVDYAGPIQFKLSSGRGVKSQKGYIAVFVCMATKAIHLEFVSDLTTSAFLAALDRMVSRRGVCKQIFSDCGTNFLGAKRELTELQRMFCSQRFHDCVQQTTSQHGIQWSMSPPGSPHFNGLAEAAVKSTKHHLRRVTEGALMTFEEITTLLCKVEAVLNSRPLLPLTSDPDDLEALTPGHFLIGHPLNAVPTPDLSDIKINRLSRWQLIERQLQQFWIRWSREYIANLQQRQKWTEDRPNLKPGELVLIRDERLPPCKWTTGRIIEVIPGTDGRVRVAKVKTFNGELLRSVVKLCPFPNSEF